MARIIAESSHVSSLDRFRLIAAGTRQCRSARACREQSFFATLSDEFIYFAIAVAAYSMFQCCDRIMQNQQFLLGRSDAKNQPHSSNSVNKIEK